MKCSCSVLNALRHQRKNHGRLSWRMAGMRRAQRLAASTEKPPIRSRWLMPFGRVLNALRHQRKNHLSIARIISSRSLCSTPCGINGKTTRFDRSTDQKCDFVLNALRHQRKNHREKQIAENKTFMCSTPCGINGKTTKMPAVHTAWGRLCSTPCGINGKTTGKNF